ELGAAYRNRTDDLRITKRIGVVRRRPLGHSRPAHQAPGFIPVHGHPAWLLADLLARLPGLTVAPRRQCMSIATQFGLLGLPALSWSLSPGSPDPNTNLSVNRGQRTASLVRRRRRG